MGFLASLVLMCSQLLYGCTLFWREKCQVYPSTDGFWKVLIKVGQCDPWVAFVSANALLHLAWVMMLFICQLYQVNIFPADFITPTSLYSSVTDFLSWNDD